MKSKSSNIWEKISLRFKLLWIWVLKNLAIVVKVSIITIAILVATNVIGSEDFLVKLLQLDALQDLPPEAWNTITGIENGVAIVISSVITVLFFLKKTNHLVIEDIKSKELKIALIKAHLYFDEKGKLCKRKETIMDKDLTDEEKIQEKNIELEPKENIITGVSRAVDELKTVLTADLTADDDEVIEEEQLHETIQEESIGLEAVEISENIAEASMENKQEDLKDADKKVSKFKLFWINIGKKIKDSFNNFKLSVKSMKEPKLDDGMDKKVKKKHKQKDIKEKPEMNKMEIEIVDVDKNDNLEILSEEKAEEISTHNLVNEAIKEEEIIAKPLNRTQSKQQEINDILKGMK